MSVFLFLMHILLSKDIQYCIEQKGETILAIERGSLIKGREYKVKYEGDSRSATRTYTGEYARYEEDENRELYDTGERLATFEGRGGIKFYEYDKIVSAVEVDPTKKKARKPITCNRCFGAGRFQHIKVDNGVCYKCGGSGTV